MDEIYFGRLVDSTEQREFKEDSIAFPDYNMRTSKGEKGMGITLYTIKEAKTDKGIAMSHSESEMLIPEKIAKGVLASALESFIRFYLPKGKYEILVIKKENDKK